MKPNEGFSKGADNLPPNNEWDTLNQFAGETNINSKTGKARSFSTFDIYPRLEGETKEEYGARLKKMHEATAKYQAEYAENARKEAYQKSEQGKREAEITAEFDRLSDKLDQAVKEGKMSAEHAERLKELRLNRSVDEIAGVQQDFEDRQSVGDPKEEARYQKWLQENDADNMKNLQESGREFTTVDDEYGVVKEKDSASSKDTTEKGKVELGEINISKIEQEFAEDKAERLKEVKEKLDKLLPDMAELYARNRRLTVGATNRANYTKAKEDYSKLLDEYLRLKSSETYEKGKYEIADKIEARVEELRAEIEKKLTVFAGGDLEKTEKSQEEIDAKKSELIKEAEEALRKEYSEEIDKQKTKINVEFLADFIAQETKLEKATVHALDNGSFCRKFVNKVINNKALKIALVGAAAAGLAVTGVGLVAGGLSIGFSLTAGGFATGALKGGLSGFLMSRQNSKNSAVRAFADESEIVRQLQGIDVTKQDASTANVAKWLMKQYGNASEKDRKSNVKKTAISVGLGAAIGGLTSGIKLGNNVTSDVTHTERVGTSPVKTEYNVEANLSQVNQPQGTGLYKTMEQMGVPKERWDEALKIAYDIEPRYGLSPGSNGVVPGFNGTVGRLAEAYPGPINTWPDTAQAFITETAKEWARQGLMPSEVIRTGGEPIYNTITNTVTDYIPNVFMNLLTRATAVVGAGAIGGSIGNMGTSREINQTSGETSQTVLLEGTKIQTAEEAERVHELINRLNELSGEGKSVVEGTKIQTAEDADKVNALIKRLNELRAQQSSAEQDDELIDIRASLEDYADRIANGEDPRAINNPEATIQIPDKLRDALGDDGVRILTDKDGYDPDTDEQRFIDLWNSLSEYNQQEIKNLLFKEYPKSENGNAFRAWLDLSGNANQ